MLQPAVTQGASDGFDQITVLRNWDLERPKQKLIQEAGITPTQAENLEREYKRYIELQVRYPGLILPMSAPVDPMWHAHMLFSKDYAAMCDQVNGRFIHHEPIVTEQERAALAPHYLKNTLSKYSDHFGKASDEFWPIDAVVCGYNGDCA